MPPPTGTPAPDQVGVDGKVLDGDVLILPVQEFLFGRHWVRLFAGQPSDDARRLPDQAAAGIGQGGEAAHSLFQLAVGRPLLSPCHLPFCDGPPERIHIRLEQQDGVIQLLERFNVGRVLGQGPEKGLDRAAQCVQYTDKI